MTVRVYRSTDASAPVLGDANSSLIGVLYACLVTGYGALSGAGWTRPYTGTNLAVFRQGTGGNGRYLRVFDGTAVGVSARRAHVRGYEAMTAVSTGTNPFPTTAQINSNGQVVHYWRTNSAGTSPRWVVVANENTFHFFVDTNTASPVDNAWETFSFGTLISRKAGDAYADFICAGSNETSNTPFYGAFGTPGHIFVARSDTNTVGAINSTPQSGVAFNASSHVGAIDANFPYPDRVTGALLMGSVDVWSGGYNRGRIPGYWHVPHGAGLLGAYAAGAAQITWSGAGDLAGKTFERFGPLAIFVSGQSFVAMEMSNTWS